MPFRCSKRLCNRLDQCNQLRSFEFRFAATICSYFLYRNILEKHDRKPQGNATILLARSKTGFTLRRKNRLPIRMRNPRLRSKPKTPRSSEENSAGLRILYSPWTRSSKWTSDKPSGFIYILVTLVACGPLGPSTMSKLTCSPSLRVLNPSS